MSRARDIADIQDNLGGAVPPFVAGKNKIINGDFGVWQRGTTFNSIAGTNIFTADRFFSNRDGTGATVNVTQQTFAPGTAPVAGYEGTYFFQFAQTVAGTGQTYNNILCQSIEDVRAFAGQTVTVSFWAKADATRNLAINLFQYFGTSGSGYAYFENAIRSVTTAWQRFTFTVAVPSIAGKTIGAGSYIQLALQSQSNNATQTWNIWGVQIETGTLATPFTTATGTIQGELAACQRYYYRQGGDALYQRYAQGQFTSTTAFQIYQQLPVTMRVTPTSIEYATLTTYNAVPGLIATSGAVVLTSDSSKNVASVGGAVAAGGVTGATVALFANNSLSSYLAFSAEL
jgi:hypothetical protein